MTTTPHPQPQENPEIYLERHDSTLGAGPKPSPGDHAVPCCRQRPRLAVASPPVGTSAGEWFAGDPEPGTGLQFHAEESGSGVLLKQKSVHATPVLRPLQKLPVIHGVNAHLLALAYQTVRSAGWHSPHPPETASFWAPQMPDRAWLAGSLVPAPFSLEHHFSQR